VLVRMFKSYECSSSKETSSVQPLLVEFCGRLD
jgi:hypothetical protein